MKNQGKKVYIVTLNNYGIFGVFENIKKAFEQSKQYANSCDETLEFDYNVLSEHLMREYINVVISKKKDIHNQMFIIQKGH